MKIEKVDVNFAKQSIDNRETITYIMPNEAFDLYGVFYDYKRSKFMRMDGDVADKVSQGVSYLATNTSGGRIRFSTDSEYIGIRVGYSIFCDMPHMPLTGSCGFVLLEKTDNSFRNVSTFHPNHEDKNGYLGEVVLKGKIKREFILFFPLYNEVESLEILLDKDANIYQAEKYRNIPPILYYGASVDQGACASRPDCAYPAIISKWNDIDFLNLCFSGNCKGEVLMAEYLSQIKCSLFVMAYDGNAPSVQFLKDTHYKFYETFRKVQPKTPILMISSSYYEAKPNADERRRVIKSSYMKARKNGDRNIYYIDGKTVYGKKDREICTVERIHPTDLGLYRIAKVVYSKIGKIDGVFRLE